MFEVRIFAPAKNEILPPKFRNEHFSIKQYFSLSELKEKCAPGCGEEVGDLVAERGIVDVLHDRHQLDRVVACKNLIFKDDF